MLRWLKNRAIPANRAYVENFLVRLGLNEKDTKGINGNIKKQLSNIYRKLEVKN